MQPADRQQFAQLITGIAEIYGKEVSQAGLRLWWDSLAHFDIADLRRALNIHNQHPDHGQFMPKPADICRHLEGSGDERSLAAWTKLMTGVKRVGTWRPLVFDDARIHAVIAEMGGWMRFGKANEKDIEFLKIEFCKRYRAYLLQPPQIFPSKILGEGGYDDEPVVIGDPAKALLVTQGGQEDVPRLSTLSEASQALDAKLLAHG